MGASRAAEAAEPQRVVHDAHSGLPTVAAAPQRGHAALRFGCQCEKNWQKAASWAVPSVRQLHGGHVG